LSSVYWFLIVIFPSSSGLIFSNRSLWSFTYTHVLPGCYFLVITGLVEMPIFDCHDHAEIVRETRMWLKRMERVAEKELGARCREKVALVLMSFEEAVPRFRNECKAACADLDIQELLKRTNSVSQKTLQARMLARRPTDPPEELNLPLAPPVAALALAGEAAALAGEAAALAGEAAAPPPRPDDVPPLQDCDDADTLIMGTDGKEKSEVGASQDLGEEAEGDAAAGTAPAPSLEKELEKTFPDGLPYVSIPADTKPVVAEGPEVRVAKRMKTMPDPYGPKGCSEKTEIDTSSCPSYPGTSSPVFARVPETSAGATATSAGATATSAGATS